MPIPQTNLFATVRTEGAILPPDLLRLVVEESKELEGLTSTAYHLIPGERLSEAATRSFNRLLTAWVNFKAAVEKLPADDPATSVTREKWLLQLFSELGYGRLSTVPSVTIEDKTYAISHGWQQTPIHLVGCRVDLDTRAAGVAGASKASPHSLLQEFLNRSTGHLWGFVSNGYKLRVLRDTRSLARQAFVEFDLQQMFEGQNYADFKLLWMICHQSRVEGDRPEQCILEKWSQVAIQRGTRLHEKLRAGVAAAIEALGRGFLAYPANTGLRARLREGKLDKQDYYRQLLRQVYRLLFLFVAEDREVLLLPGEAYADARKTFLRYYSTRRLREFSGSVRGSPHPDLYCALKLVFGKLNVTGCPELALPALGSLLWSDAATPDLDTADLANRDLLNAIHKLAFTQDETTKSLRPVDYRNLGSEEFGSVYESLLELHPEINSDIPSFALSIAAGSERKTSASYYTPSSLVNCLLDSALDPVVADAIKGKSSADAEKSLLALKVCDPACGSGHFLIAAAHRLAKRLAAIRTGEEEPAPDLYRHALRDVIRHCIYGVDLNPMAVELCRVALWMESLEPGKPLSFLEAHIKVGNSLIGATPALLAKGIPDEAFEPIEGDDKAVCRELKQRNKKEREAIRKGQTYLFDMPLKLGNIPDVLAQIVSENEDSVSDVQRHQEIYAQAVSSVAYENARFLADAWCASFVWLKDNSDVASHVITEKTFRDIERSPHNFPATTMEYQETHFLATYYHFFHWHLEFPDVFTLPGKNVTPTNSHSSWCGGFDLVLGNPPWDTLSPDAKEFFSTYDPKVRSVDKTGQEKIMRDLLQQQNIRKLWEIYNRDLYALVQFLKESGRFRLYAPGNLGKGDFNVFRMFVESALDLCAPERKVSQIVPEGFYNGANCMAIRQEIFEHFRLLNLMCFINTREVWFKSVHTAAKFCLYTAEKWGKTETLRAAFNIDSEAALVSAISGEVLSIPVTMIREFSPDALAVAELTGQVEIDIASKMYARCPKFGDVTAGPPRRQYMCEIHMGNNRDLFDEVPAGLPLYEGRMVQHYDHRAKGYRSGRGREADWEELPFECLDKSIQPQWYIPCEKLPDKARDRVGQYRVGFCDVASPTNERSLVAAIIPPNCICGHKVPTITFDPENAVNSLLWLTVANTYIMDFLARKKISLTMSLTVVDSLPFPRFLPMDKFAKVLAHRALLLTCTAPEMNTLWDCIAAHGCAPARDTTKPVPGVLDEVTRLQVTAEIEAMVALNVYGLSRDQVAYIMETFPIVKRHDTKRYGTYRTRDTILEIYDAMATATSTGQPYQTCLNPPPGLATDAVGNFIPMEQWNPAAWPSHIHPPQGHQVTRPSIKQREEGLAVLHALCLLYAFENAAPDRRTFDLGMILLDNDALRNRVLKRQFVGSASTKVGLSPRIGHIDEFLVELVGSETLAVTTGTSRQLVKLGAKAPTKDTLLADPTGKTVAAKANEAVRAVAILAEQGQSLELYVGVNEDVSIDLAVL